MLTRTIPLMTMTALTLACTKTTPLAETPQTTSTATEASSSEPLAPPSSSQDGQSRIVVAPSIREMCSISDAEAFFEYDSSQVSSKGLVMLERLANCFDSGPLEGERMSLVGHADERGSEEYNMQLGRRRADSVKDALRNLGLNEKVITTSSRGESSATGSDPAGWLEDRRVDVTLGR